MRYKMVVADCDGTLVEKGGDILPEVREAVDAFRTRGGVFTLATGRPTGGVRHYAEHLHLDVPVIVFNGSLIYDFTAGRSLHGVFLPLDLARRALELAREFPVDPFLYGEKEIFVGRMSPRVEAYMRKDRVRCHPVGDLASHLGERGQAPPKILFYGPVRESIRLMERLGAEGFPDINFVQSDADYIELLPAGVSKGSALAWLAGYLGVPLDKVMAIGDHHNDMDLLRRAGLGVAVANAEPEVRSRAARVTGASFGLGVAEALQDLI